jgi:hypothetical protein
MNHIPPYRFVLREDIQIEGTVSVALYKGVLLKVREKITENVPYTELMRLLQNEARKSARMEEDVLFSAMVDYWLGLYEKEKTGTDP